MSNKTRLQTNNTNLQALIDKANALPDAGSVGMCTVNITCTSEILSLEYSAISDTGALEYIDQFFGDNANLTTYSFQCVPNTLIHLTTKYFETAMVQQNITQGLSFSGERGHYYYFLVTAEAGGTARLIMSSESMT